MGLYSMSMILLKNVELRWLFADRIVSLLQHQGVFQICSDPNYRGWEVRSLTVNKTYNPQWKHYAQIYSILV